MTARKINPEYVDVVKALAESELCGNTVGIRLGPFSLFRIIGMLQLALRHPEMHALHAHWIRAMTDIINQMGATLAVGYADPKAGQLLLACIAEGFNPDNDPLPDPPDNPDDPARQQPDLTEYTAPGGDPAVEHPA